MKKQKQFITASARKEADGKIVFVATDETRDRHGEIVPIDNWDLKNYKRNPVLLVNHDYRVQAIVGRAKNIKLVDGRMEFEPEFHLLTQLSVECDAMVKEGHLNTVSVGFMPIYPRKEGDPIKNELLEISLVPVPANPRAERIKTLVDEETVDDETEKKIKEFTEDEEEITPDEAETTDTPAEEPQPTTTEEDEQPVIDTEEQLKEAIAKGGSVHCSAELLSKLIQQPAAGNENKGRADKKVAPRVATKQPVDVQVLRLVAKEINRALFNAKRQNNG